MIGLTRFIGVLTVALILVTQVYAEEQSTIVYGSYTSLKQAESRRTELEGMSTAELRIREFQVRGMTYFRILGGQSGDMKSQLRLLADVRRRLESQAWLLLEESPLAETSQTESRAGSGLSNQVQSYPVSPASTDALSEAQEPLPGEMSSVAVAEDRHPLPVQAETKEPVLDGSSILPLQRMEVTATTDPLVLQKFDEKAINIKIDGRLDEPVWSLITGIDRMSVVEPDTLEQAELSTVTKFLYSEKGLYVGIWNEQDPATLLPRLAKRDGFINRDGNSLLIDTSGDALYGLWFDVNLGGSLADGMLLPEKTFTLDWDGPWRGESAETADGYTTEFFLPWSMMAMPEAEEDRKMSVMIMRRVAYKDEYWGWPALPYSAPKFISAMQPILLNGIAPRQQWALYPFISSTSDEVKSETGYRSGVDIFWRPSSNLQLTATLNPDFGTVESDNVVVNLTAFETFHREKRLFFVEGNEVFVTTPRANPFGSSSSYNIGARKTPSSFYPSPTSLVNTRRIGSAALTPDIPAGVDISDVELFQPTELAGAIKATGQQGRLRYGVLAAFEEDVKFHGSDTLGNRVRINQDGRDFGVVRLAYEDGSDGLKSLGWITTAVTHPDRDAFVHGLDAHYISSNAMWRADAQLMYSDIHALDETGADINEGFGGMFDLSYRPEKGVKHTLKLDYLDEDLEINDLGFFRRNDVISMNYGYERLSSNMDYLRSWTRSLSLSQEYNQDGRVVRSGIFWRNLLTFPNSMQLRTELNYFPERWDDRNSEGNGEFRIEDRWVAEVGIGTDSSKKLSVSLAVGMFQEELGGWTRQAKGGFTFKPNDRLSLDLDFIYQRRDGWLLHEFGRNFAEYKSTNWIPSMELDYFISARQQIQLALQWAGIRAHDQDHYEIPAGDGDLIQLDSVPWDSDFGLSQLTVQLRYRWEIAPLSDLFIVYTRGSNLVRFRNLASVAGKDDFVDFEGLFNDALSDPLVERLVIKLRYRFGT